MRRRIADIGAVLVVEGPNDRIALAGLDVPAFAICGNHLTARQADKLAAVANDIGVPVALMFDNDQQGYQGAVKSLPAIAELAPVWFAWSPKSHGGAFADWQPERLHQSPEAWETVRSARAWGGNPA